MYYVANQNTEEYEKWYPSDEFWDFEFWMSSTFEFFFWSMQYNVCNVMNTSLETITLNSILSFIPQILTLYGCSWVLIIVQIPWLHFQSVCLLDWTICFYLRNINN